MMTLITTILTAKRSWNANGGSGEDGWYYDDEGDERDDFDDYGYDDEYRDDD